MDVFNCANKCCKILINSEISDDKYYNNKVRKFKAGVFIYDPKKHKILLVQSNGNLWGPPKGTLKYAETYRECAIREVREESGININGNLFSKLLHIIDNNIIYFYMEYPTCEVTIHNHLEDINDINDSTGLMWIRPDCLEQLIYSGQVKITKHTYLLVYKFLSILLPFKKFPRNYYHYNS
tara:strand:+ start:2136 stop:2678 length:543 start_codon:yes stop_codon:yes gene_type:complete